MSHGTGRLYGSHYDTALALAEAGFVVIAISHTGDTYQDGSRAARVQDRRFTLTGLGPCAEGLVGRDAISESGWASSAFQRRPCRPGFSGAFLT